MKKKTKGFIAGAAGVGLLMSGTTLALWNDSAVVDDATITSGNLAVATVAHGEYQNVWEWVDTSDDRLDDSHLINIENFRIIPGDTIEGTIALDVALEGENMVALLGADLSGVTTAGDLDLTTGDFRVTDAADNPITIAPDGTIELASEDNGDPGSLPTVGKTLDGSPDLFVTVPVTFPASVTGQTDVLQSVTLSGAMVTLDQVRSPATGFTP